MLHSFVGHNVAVQTINYDALNNGMNLFLNTLMCFRESG